MPTVSRTIVDALAPLITDARGLVDLRRSLSTAVPSADSPAMAERLKDVDFADVWGEMPVTTGQNYVSMLVYVAEDHLECLCRLLDQPDFVPVWGLAPIARALLEAAGRAAYLGRTGAGARSRVESYMNERLHSLDQISHLPEGARDQDGVRSQRLEILASGERKGFVRQPHRDPAKAENGALADPPQFGTGRPGYLDVVRRLFDGVPEMGKGVFQWLAAGSHSSVWDVEKHFRIISQNALGQTAVELGRNPVEVFHILNSALHGYIQMATVFLVLWGVCDDRWRHRHRELNPNAWRSGETDHGGLPSITGVRTGHSLFDVARPDDTPVGTRRPGFA